MNMVFIEVAVSIESLNEKLIDAATGAPVNSEAAAIDEEIFFYIPEDIASKSAAEIADFVSDNCW